MVRGLLFDLLMGVMDSVRVWSAAAGDCERGLAWRDAVTARMAAARAYVPYEDLLDDGAAQVDLPPAAVSRLLEGWQRMEPWPDAASLARLSVPYAFVTNCSAALAKVAADRSRLAPEFVLSAEDAGWYKPAKEIYRVACHRMGLEPAEALFVAGSPHDAEGARAAGLQSAFVQRRKDQRAPDGVMTLESLTEVVATLVR